MESDSRVNPAALPNNKPITVDGGRRGDPAAASSSPSALSSSQRCPANEPAGEEKKQNDPKPPSQMWDIYGGPAALKFPIRIPNVVSDPTECWDRIRGPRLWFSHHKKSKEYKKNRLSALWNASLFPSFLVCLIMLEAVWAVNPPTLSCCKHQFLLKKNNNK